MADHEVLRRPNDEFTIYRELRNKLKLDHAAVCGIMANICAESDFQSTVLQGSYSRKLGFGSSEYTERVDRGLISREEFAHDGAGYGLCQWTFPSRKEELYRFLKNRQCSIGDLQGQTDFLICELKNSFPDLLTGLRKRIFRHSVLIKNEKYPIETRDSLKRACDAAYFFCAVFEEPDEAVFYEQCRERGRLAEVLYAQYAEPFAGKFRHGRKYGFVPEKIEDIFSRQMVRRDYCFIDGVSPCMKKAIVSLEDIAFYRHNGIDFPKTALAVFKSVCLKKRIGGSTITQQLARNLYLTREKTVIRKLKEMRIARYIEKRLSKDQILELYLNIIYYGHGAYGITDAGRRYFDCDPSQLLLSQSVALCAMIPAPSRFNPFANKDLFLKRTEIALGILQKHRDIDEEGTAQVKKETKEFVRRVEARIAGINEKNKKNYRRAVLNKGMSGWNNYREKTDLCMEKGGDTPETFVRYRVEYNESLKKRMSLCGYPSPGGERFLFHHLFFHSLILEPEKAFRHVSGDEDFESWFISLEEFRKILLSLYGRGYVLVDMRKLLDGQIRLPAGKTPLVLSFDDMNYYGYMKDYGFVSRMVPDKNGGISYVKEENGKTVEIKNGDSVAVLEEFISGHPDFSYDGARGIIGLTGYEGLFGYRDLSDPDLAEVVKNLKNMGWDFACHSFSHKSGIYNNTVPNAPKGIEDADRWLDGPGRILGKTDIFITPFGADIRNNPQLLKYLKEKGFVYFCSVADRRSVETDGESFYIQRYSVDGVMMQTRQYDFEFYYGNLSSIYDPARKIPFRAPGADAQSFVRHAYTCMRMPTVYCMGGMGQILTRDWLLEAKKANPDYYGNNDTFEMLWNIPNGEIRCFDCSGLVKRFLMGGLSHFSYDRSMDMNTKIMLDRAEVKGSIDTMPEQPGIILYMQDHVGIYVGKGRVIESTPSIRLGNGVVMAKVSDRPWTHWFRLNGICYDSAADR